MKSCVIINLNRKNCSRRKTGKIKIIYPKLSYTRKNGMRKKRAIMISKLKSQKK